MILILTCIYAAFIDRAAKLIKEQGYTGALTASTFKTNRTFRNLREIILFGTNPLVLMLDVGLGILDDATVETAAIVLRGGRAC